MSTYFFDSSALAKLYHRESGSRWVQELVRSRGHRVLISRLTVVEMHSVFAVKVRTQAISADEAVALRRRFLSDIQSGLFEILAIAPSHYERAQNLIVSYGFRYGLRTLDALQISVAAHLPKGLLDGVVATDRAFCDVATSESFLVLNPDQEIDR